MVRGNKQPCYDISLFHTSKIYLFLIAESQNALAKGARSHKHNFNLKHLLAVLKTIQTKQCKCTTQFKNSLQEQLQTGQRYPTKGKVYL